MHTSEDQIQSLAPSDGVVALPDNFSTRYTLGDELGRGGMGVVYRAHDSVTQTQVAIKFLPPRSDKDSLRRFQREAADLASLFHPNVVSFFGGGESEGRPFLVMEYVDGGNLLDYLKRTASLKEILVTFSLICDGLSHMHDQGIVHRDLKPENILVTSRGVPKITDFGLARRVDNRSHLTQSGSILGTFAYLAPEQVMSSSAVGPSADLYSLGVCLFQAATGEVPFVHDTPYLVLNSHIAKKPPIPSSVKPGLSLRLDSLILSLLEKKPADRPRTAGQVKKELQACALLASQESLQPGDDAAWAVVMKEARDLVKSSRLEDGAARLESLLESTRSEPARFAEVCNFLAEIRLQQGAIKKVQELCRRSLSEMGLPAGPAPVPPGPPSDPELTQAAVKSYELLSRACYEGGQVPESMDCLQTAIGFSTAIADSESRLRLLIVLGRIQLLQNRLSEAKMSFEGGLAGSQQPGCAERRLECLENLAQIHQTEGRLDSAAECLRRGLEVAGSAEKRAELNAKLQRIPQREAPGTEQWVQRAYSLTDQAQPRPPMATPEVAPVAPPQPAQSPGGEPTVIQATPVFRGADSVAIPQAPRKSPLPGVLAAVALLVVCFGLGFYFLSDKPTETAADSVDALSQARELYAAGEFRVAAELGKGALAVALEDGEDTDEVLEMREFVAQACYKAQQYPGAIEQYEELAKLRPSEAKYQELRDSIAVEQKQANRDLAMAKIENGSNQLANGSLIKAIQMGEAAITLLRHSEGTEAQMAAAYRLVGRAYYQNGDSHNAAQYLRQAISYESDAESEALLASLEGTAPIPEATSQPPAAEPSAPRAPQAAPRRRPIRRRLGAPTPTGGPIPHRAPGPPGPAAAPAPALAQGATVALRPALPAAAVLPRYPRRPLPPPRAG